MLFNCCQFYPYDGRGGVDYTTADISGLPGAFGRCANFLDHGHTVQYTSTVRLFSFDHRALIIIERVRQEGEGGGLELQLPASSFLNELLFYSINKCKLFIYYK
jgi:hypothetical protein